MIDYIKQNIVEEVKKITKGKGVPVVVDGVGKDTWAASLDCLQPRGLMVSFGNASGPVPPVALGILSFAVPLDTSIAMMVLPTMLTNVWQAIYGGGFRTLMKRFGTMAAASVIRSATARTATHSSARCSAST